jgi:hypothetical protein
MPFGAAPKRKRRRPAQGAAARPGGSYGPSSLGCSGGRPRPEDQSLRAIPARLPSRRQRSALMTTPRLRSAVLVTRPHDEVRRLASDLLVFAGGSPRCGTRVLEERVGGRDRVTPEDAARHSLPVCRAYLVLELEGDETSSAARGWRWISAAVYEGGSDGDNALCGRGPLQGEGLCRRARPRVRLLTRLLGDLTRTVALSNPGDQPSDPSF